MRPPFRSTYRLQLNAAFTLADARARLPYLDALGISHVYCSPILAARTGSSHGYDVTDPTRISDALGGEDAFVALADATHGRGMGILLDIVPNHMGVGADNPYWDDVLRLGRQSRYADWFDVAWRPSPEGERGRVLLPILGNRLEHVVARGEITLRREADAYRIRYFDHSFPIDPATLPAEVVLEDYAGDGAGSARLKRLLSGQHYRLAHWRSAQRDLNYRRFFDVNDLVSLRVEREDVFRATHRVVLDLVARGLVDGLRVDHIDGLLEPARYLDRLDAAVTSCTPAGEGIPVFVEKILARGERLPLHWKTSGTTGYEFLAAIDDVQVDPDGAALMEEQYTRASMTTFRRIAMASRRRMLRTTLNADVRRIAPMLARVGRHAFGAEATIAAYARAVVELVVQLPVYRTYIDADRPTATGGDRALLEAALQRARPLSDPIAGEALFQVLLGDWTTADAGLARERLSFVLRFQQLCGPAAAKGVEDTALYAWAPVASRSEVGGDPGASVAGAREHLLEMLTERALCRPQSLNATTTHDTKRSADARSRLDALTSHAAEWRRYLRRWSGVHRDVESRVRGHRVPGRLARDFIIQSLIALWPLAGEAPDDALRTRLSEYMRKAGREAKVATSWAEPDGEYESAVDRYIAALLSSENQAFHDEVSAFVGVLDVDARWRMLGRTVVQHTAPGVPDLYRGDECWFTALVDPDNRRSVDWESRESALERVSSLERVADAGPISDLKLATIRALLALRREEPALFLYGTFEPLAVEGTFAERIVAFRRAHAGREVITIAAMRTQPGDPTPTGGSWGDTRVVSNAGATYRCVLHDAPLAAGAGDIWLRDAFRSLPAAVLIAW